MFRPRDPARQGSPERGRARAGGGGADFAATLTELLRDVALALDENEPFLREAFGPDAVLAAAGGLQRVCDEEGGRVLQRFIQLRRLSQLVKEVGSLSSARRAADGTGAAPPQPVDPRQARAALARRRPAAPIPGPLSAQACQAQRRAGCHRLAQDLSESAAGLRRTGRVQGRVMGGLGQGRRPRKRGPAARGAGGGLPGGAATAVPAQRRVRAVRAGGHGGRGGARAAGRRARERLPLQPLQPARARARGLLHQPGAPPPRGTPVTTRRLHDTEALRRLAAGSRHSMRHMCPSRRTPGYIHGTPRLPEP